jgi:5,10-methylenetetrahydromethanopterin reductase
VGGTVRQMRIGTTSAVIGSGTIDEVVAEVRQAAADGMHTFWAPQIFSHDTLTVLAIAGREVPGIELGTGVVPTYPRHPMMLAQQALTVQAATGGRLVLGIGLSHHIVVEMMWGLSFDKPVRHMREYLSVLLPLLDGEPVAFNGDEFRVNAAASVAGGSRPPVLVAALGAQMLRVTGTLADGTATWCVGPKTLRDLTVPTLRQAAADAGRPEPRVVCALPISVTEDVDAARRLAAKVFAVYDTLPSYKTMMDNEGVSGPGDLAIVGTEAEVRDQLAELATIGVTDFNAGIFASDPEEIARTKAVLRQFATATNNPV